MKFFIRAPFTILAEKRTSEQAFYAELSVEGETKDEAIRKFLSGVQEALKSNLTEAEGEIRRLPEAPPS